MSEYKGVITESEKLITFAWDEFNEEKKIIKKLDKI